MISKTTVEGSTSYTYDNNNNLLTVTDENGTISRTYDSLNRVTSYTDSKGNTIEYEYDGNSNLTKLIYPDNKIVRYSYNANNQLAKVQDWANRITIYDYYENGNLKSESRPNGSIQTYTYNEIGQLIQTVDKAQDGTIINEYSYEYDADGNVITENSLYEPDYDNVTIPDSEMLYGKGNQLTEFNETAVMYDLDGNMLNTPLGDKWGLLTYNSQNYLTDIVTSDSAIAYEYDAEGYRIAKTEYGTTTSYVVNSNAELSQVLMSTKNGEITYYIYGLGLIAQENSEGYKTYHYDYRGSTTAITDENGIVTDRVYYDVYGNILSRTGITDTPYLYVGQYGIETDDSGLYYMRARYYNPTIQRFVNIDPIRNGCNWYGYTSGNPINYIDPTGYMDWGKQGSIYTQGMYDCMVDFRISVDNEIEKLRNNPLEYLYDKANGIKQDVNDLCIGIANGEITVGSIVKGAFNWTKETISDIYDWGYKWSPFTEISDEEAYQLGYDAEKALLDTSTFVVKSAVTHKIFSCLGKLGSKAFGKIKTKVVGVNKSNKFFNASFLSEKKLVSHFEKHGTEFKGMYNSPDEYLQGARDVMNNGYKVEYFYKGETRVGYVQYMGNTSKGKAKFAFVGTNNAGYITTFHTKSGKELWKMLNGNNDQVINPI